MIYSLNGRVAYALGDTAVIECGGVGYACKTTLGTLSELSVGETATLYTHLAVREDAVELFGFYSLEELECFRLLISVSGVGARFALAILSSMTPSSMAMAIASGNQKEFSKVKGIGPKIAQRIVMELKDKITREPAEALGQEGASLAGLAAGSAVQEAVAALVVLGYSQSEAVSAVSGCGEDMAADEIIKQALKRLASGRLAGEL